MGRSRQGSEEHEEGGEKGRGESEGSGRAPEDGGLHPTTLGISGVRCLNVGIDCGCGSRGGLGIR